MKKSKKIKSEKLPDEKSKKIKSEKLPDEKSKKIKSEKIPDEKSKKIKTKGYDVTQDPRWKTSSAFRSIFLLPSTSKYSKPSQISTKMASAMGQL